MFHQVTFWIGGASILCKGIILGGVEARGV